MATLAWAEPLRIATFHAELSRKGPGLLLQDILAGQEQVMAAAQVIAGARPDVLLLLGFDYDLDGLALTAFAGVLDELGAPYPYRFASRPNTGWATGLDLDGDGRLGGPRDSQGYGEFSGQGGMAVLSRLPIEVSAARDFSLMLWRDLPGADLPETMTPEVKAVQRLSTTGHWEVPITLPSGETLRLLAWHASPPVFDGPEDRNGRRNSDETAFWLRLLEGALPHAPPQRPFVILGDANLDPVLGDGRPANLLALMAHPAVQDPRPKGAADLATADFTARDGPGRLRVDYILPSADLAVRDAAVVWPDLADGTAPTVETASRHRLVWVDLDLP